MQNTYLHFIDRANRGFRDFIFENIKFFRFSDHNKKVHYFVLDLSTHFRKKNLPDT